MESVRSKDVVTTFLSCSVRPNDWALVDSLVQRVLTPHGFRCFTIGRNVSLAEQTDDAVRRLMTACECLMVWLPSGSTQPTVISPSAR